VKEEKHKASLLPCDTNIIDCLTKNNSKITRVQMQTNVTPEQGKMNRQRPPEVSQLYS
jgi:hypothetical protein